MTGALGPEIERLPGVLAATVFPDSPGGPRAFVAVRDDADHAAIRSTALALLRDHGVHTDPDRFHIGTAPSTPPVATTLPTLSLDSLDVHCTDNRVECTVRLRTPDRHVASTATEPDTPAGRARAAARATLGAAESLDPELRLGLHGAQVRDLFGFDTVAILVEASIGRHHLQLPGTALLERSMERAAARATLQALRSWRA